MDHSFLRQFRSYHDYNDGFIIQTFTEAKTVAKIDNCTLHEATAGTGRGPGWSCTHDRERAYIIMCKWIYALYRYSICQDWGLSTRDAVRAIGG